jgi:hypothetical protein
MVSIVEALPSRAARLVHVCATIPNNASYETRLSVNIAQTWAMAKMSRQRHGITIHSVVAAPVRAETTLKHSCLVYACRAALLCRLSTRETFFLNGRRLLEIPGSYLRVE